MVASIEQLEKDKRDLEAENTRMIEENRELLDQLEGLNISVAESDAHIKSLTVTLTSAQCEVRRLTVLESRTTQLEAQLLALETEQAHLQEELGATKEEGRSAVSRWRLAESTLRDLRDQVERIEQERNDERERHAELLDRMERRKAVESHLQSDAGAQEDRSAKPGPGVVPVVSHFVRDILQDNANLQMGLLELREMLQSSNEEVQNLREQIVLHQPLAFENEGASIPLSDELEEKDPLRRISQELHVHHHYHAPSETNAPKKLPSYRRPRRKRGVLPIGVITPSNGSQTPRTPSQSRDFSKSSATAALLSQTSVSVPPHSSHNRWSLQSVATGSPIISSIPSSPTSGRRTSSIFDRMDYGFDSSRPTSPESNGVASPLFDNHHRKGASLSSFRSFSGPTVPQADQSTPAALNSSNLANPAPGLFTPVPVKTHQTPQVLELAPEATMSPPVHPTIPEELEDECPESQLPHPDTESDPQPEESDLQEGFFTPPGPHGALRRAASHESLLSVSGMDIHTLRDRPSQSFFAVSSSKAVVDTTNVTANSMQHNFERPFHASSRILLSELAPARSSEATTETRQGLGQRVSGWVWGKWGVAPIASSGNLRAQASANTTPFDLSRPPGINQKGPIPGLRPPKRTPSAIHVKVIDEGLLKESLEE